VAGRIGWSKNCYLAGLILVIGFLLPLRAVYAQTDSSVNAPSSPPLVGTNVPGSPAIPKAKLTLRVYNYARVDSASLAQAEKIAEAVFGRVGIGTHWVDCPTSAAKFQAYPACQSDMGTTDLVLRILPRQMAVKLQTSGESLGFARACPRTASACELTIFYHRIDELAAREYRVDQILGHAIAHEIAHVLIGPGHSADGIMRAEWGPADLERISWGLQMDFTHEQSRQLREAVLRRMTPPVQEGLERAD
jgi:hypothetical protein